MNTEDKKYRKALEKVRRMRGFYIHLVTYILINTMLFLLNIMTSPNVLWFYWPLLGWGIGIAMHAFYVFGFGRWFGSDWKEKKIKEIME